MTTRRPLQPLSPLANSTNTRYTHFTTTRSNVAMEEPEDTQDLSSLDADDEFERRMIQNARDERRLKEALNGSTRVQAFRKARAPRLGLTIDNVERNNARNHGAPEANAHVKFESPPSSSGSTRSDPAIHAPAAWGRKSRSNRNWMRTITYEEQLQTTPPPADDTANGLHDDQYEHEGDENHPRRSVEDSPLSHKGTPRNDRSAEWDLTFELNEASIIASTPYIPRNTMLDDIRQREVESSTRDTVPESSAQETRRPRLLPQTGDANTAEPATTSPEKRLRTNSWKSIGKSQPVTGSGKESSPVTIYKTSTETVSVWEQDIPADTQRGLSRPARHRREDSQDLLRRLARVSNTPSPRRIEPPRPQTAPASQLHSAPQTISDNEPQPAPSIGNNAPEAEESPLPEASSKAAVDTPATISQEEPKDSPADHEAPQQGAPEKEPEDVDATPMPSERTRLDPKTPVVTGAWVDTPGPRTIQKHITIARSPSSSPKKGSPRKNKSPVKLTAARVDDAIEEAVAEAIRPQLPSSALQALVQDAKANGRRRSADFGDSTINSLEDLISPEGEIDEDTLQGLQLPTMTPRNEAERQRQQELQHLHRMNDRLRAARTSIRDASRGMKRVEDRVEHGEEVEGGVKAVVRDCPCAVEGHHPFSIWSSLRSLFWDTSLKTKRQGTSRRTLGGLTMLSILMLLLFTWWISEEIACELYCHHPYTKFSPYQYSVNPNAPQFPFVIPTLVWRKCFWWIPAGSVASWIGRSAHNAAVMHQSASSTAAWAAQSQTAEEFVWEQSMLRDEVI